MTSIRCLVDHPVTGDPPNKLHMVSFEQDLLNEMTFKLGLKFVYGIYIFNFRRQKWENCTTRVLFKSCSLCCIDRLVLLFLLL